MNIDEAEARVLLRHAVLASEAYQKSRAALRADSGAAVRAIMRASGLGVRATARAIGMSPTYVSMVARGRMEVSASLAKRLLGLPLLPEMEK